MQTRHKISELNQLFSDGETQDKELFAEQRSNVQLVAGEHYSKKGDKFWNRIRNKYDLTLDQKIRLTKNHIQKIVHIYTNQITSYSPGVSARAKEKNQPSHQKRAELVNAVWQNHKDCHDFNLKINQFAFDFVGIGEVACKIFFDPCASKFLGMEAELDEHGQVALDENGQPQPSDVARFLGDVVIERIYGFNLIRPASAKDIKTAPWLAIRKMCDIDEIKNLISMSNILDDDEKEKLKQKVVSTMDETYVVLDGTSGNYRQTKDQAMVREFYFRPCSKYPQGYFYICLQEDIVFEGELPFGIFPIIVDGFNEIQTSPRHRSIVKQLRPYQVEINRCASTIAEHQITMGWDKIIVQSGTKLQKGVSFPGVRSFSVSGPAPTVLEGRTGTQYLEYMSSQIAEMYQVAMLEEQLAEKDSSQLDVYSMLSRSIKDKKKFSLYTDKFENFLRNVFKTYISLCQQYYTPQHLIPAIGKSEYVNIAEFKAVDDLSYSIVVDPQCDDAESKLGKQLMLQHLIQYVGPQLAKDDLGKIIRLMPFANDELILDDLTLDYDLSTNYILALDRGEQPQPPTTVDQAYLIKKLENRMGQPDFILLNPMIQQTYSQRKQMHEQIKVQQEMAIKQAQQEFIPTGGYLVACDFYVPDPADPGKLPKRVRLPSEALDWLLKQLASQGSSQQTLSGISQGSLSDMSQMLMKQMPQQGVPAMGQQPPLMRPMGPTSPQRGLYGN